MSKNVENQIEEAAAGAPLTPTQERLLGFIVSQSAQGGSVRISKGQLAKRLDCCLRTVDHAVRGLRDAGYIEVAALYGEDGGQICNEYRLTELAVSGCKLGKVS